MKFNSKRILTTISAVALLASSAFAAGQSKNPVVAKVGDKSIYYMDVIARKNALPELRNAPIDSVREALVQQMVAELLIAEKVKSSNLDNDPEVKAKVKKCKEAAKMQVFIERQVDKLVTDEALMSLFKELMKDYKKQKEVHAHHILVSSQADANAVIKMLEAGKDFGEVARQKSIDPSTKERGGDLGFFVKDLAKETMGPEFAESVFIIRPGNFTRKPVKTKFGYHIVKVSDSRMSKPPKYEQVAPQLRMVKSQEALLTYINSLKKEKKVQFFDMNGKPVADKAKVKVKK